MAGAAEPGDDWDWEDRDRYGVTYSKRREQLQEVLDEVYREDSDDEISDPGFNIGEASFMSSYPNRSNSTKPERDVPSKGVLPSIEKHHTKVEEGEEVGGEATGEGGQVIEGH